jgi:hypothetical protein
MGNMGQSSERQKVRINGAMAEIHGADGDNLRIKHIGK